MTDAELIAFAALVRAECDAALARMATVDPAFLPPRLRELYEDQRKRWLELRALTEGDALARHQAACEHAGRELTQEEAWALVKRQ